MQSLRNSPHCSVSQQRSTSAERLHTLPTRPAAIPARASGAGVRSEIPPVVWIVCAIGGGIAVLMLLAMLANSFLSTGRQDTASPRSTEDSPILSDGQVLAALSSHRMMRLICWNRDGNLLFDEAARGVPRMLPTGEHAIQWLLDGKGWLLSGHIFDRESKRVILKVRHRFGYDPIVHMIDERRLLGVFGHPQSEIALIEVPWEKLRQSLKLIEDGAPAIVTPGQPVSIRVELESLVGGAEDTRSQLTNALTARLARDGLRVESGQDAVFRLRFTEQMGNAPPIFERQSLSNPRSVDTGRTAIGTKEP